MGTPDFAVPGLAALREAGHDIRAVYTQKPRPSGRGHAVQASPVQRYAEAHGLGVRHPASLRDPAAIAEFAALDLDAAVVAAYGLILPRAVLEAPLLGCLNIHASLLPRWRGAAPIERAILAGDAETGVTIMRMEAGLDTGAILLAESVAIGPRATASALHDDLATRGAALLLRALDENPPPRDQLETGATYAKKLRREEGALDWRRAAAELDRVVRGLNPRVPTWFAHDGTRIRVLEAEPVAETGAPGRVLDHAPTVACGAGALRLLRLQREGRAAMSAAEFLRGHALPPGTVLPCPATS